MQMFQLDGITPPETIIINHVWSDANDEPRETHHVSDILGRESTKVLGVRLTLLSSSLWCNIGIAMDQELLQNASSRLLEDNKFMAHTLQAGHTRDGENHHYTLSVDMLQGTFTRTLCAFSPFSSNASMLISGLGNAEAFENREQTGSLAAAIWQLQYPNARNPTYLMNATLKLSNNLKMCVPRVYFVNEHFMGIPPLPPISCLGTQSWTFTLIIAGMVLYSVWERAKR